MKYNSFGNYNFQNNINSINNFPQERPKFVNPFSVKNNYPSFDDDSDYSKSNNNNINNKINLNEYNRPFDNNTNFNNNYNTIQNNLNNNYNNPRNSFNNNININNNIIQNNINNNYNNPLNNFNNNNTNINNNNFNNNNSNNIFQNNVNNNYNNFNNNSNNFNDKQNNINNNNTNYNINYIDYNSFPKENKDNDFEILNSSKQENNNFTQNLIRTMSVFNSSKNTSWKDNLKSFVSTLFYNNHNFSIKLDKDSIKFPLIIFNKKIDNIIRDELKYPLKSFLYMSYKSNFPNLNNIGCENYTSDCGWGCMLRCCQMLLSKALIQKKIFDFFENKKNVLIDSNTMNKIRNDILNLFNDNYLPIELTKENEDYKYFWYLYENLAKTNKIFNSISEIIPPYSIHILSKFGNCAGVYTSDHNIIKIFLKINCSIFNNELKFVHFQSGSISKKILFSSFCEECTNFTDVNNLITYNGVDYKFIKSGIIFISLRLGLQNLDESYYNLIPLIFRKIRHNFGIVGGRKNRAYYFIGIQEDNKLIFSDPHLNQEMTGNIWKDNEKYYNENLYLMDIKEMSSGFSFAVGIFNKMHLEHFLDDINFFHNSEFKECIYFDKY